MASPFSLSKSGKKGAGREEYQKLLARETARYKGDRDRAVRSANIAAGYGSSTAERFKGGGKATPAGGGKAAPKKDGGGGKKKVDRQKTSSTGGNVPMPMARPTQFSPDLAVSPRHEADIHAGSAPTNTPPRLDMMSPDLAVSPPHEPDPMMGAPTNNPLPMSLNAAELAPSPYHPPDPMQGAPQGGLVPPLRGPMSSPILAPPVVGSGGPVGAGNPLVGAQPGPNPVVGSGNQDRRNFFARLLGLGG